MKPSIALPGLLLALTIPSLARADVPPSPDYVERCTVAKEQGPGTECINCGDAYHSDRDACERKYGGDYSRRCKTSGASVWNEVWCRPAAAPAPAPAPAPEVAPPPAPDAGKGAAPSPAASTTGGGNCSLVAGDADGLAGAGWLLALAGLGLARSRRSRR